ncbi:MAG TPA: TetR family transcriptional regulator [Solirubrobacteraceae bacterium]|nr:TetR family transcriptional regulator [Solirubrobacteraceae bacterium]
MAPLTREEILRAAEEVLRRHGPAKTNVVDVARALNVSHGSVYRHFPSKAALREAVAERFLETVCAPLEDIDDPKEWFDALIAGKRARAQQDPELFATYVALARESGDVVNRHVDHLIRQLTRIVGDEQTARALFDATARWHDPRHADEWAKPGTDDAFEAVWALLAEAMARPASSASVGRRGDQAMARPASSAHSSAAR